MCRVRDGAPQRRWAIRPRKRSCGALQVRPSPSPPPAAIAGSNWRHTERAMALRLALHCCPAALQSSSRALARCRSCTMATRTAASAAQAAAAAAFTAPIAVGSAPPPPPLAQQPRCGTTHATRTSLSTCMHATLMAKPCTSAGPSFPAAAAPATLCPSSLASCTGCMSATMARRRQQPASSST